MNNNKLSYFEAKDWIKANVSSEAFSCIVKNINFPTITENTEGKYKKWVDKNNEISLELIKNITEIKKSNAEINCGQINIRKHVEIESTSASGQDLYIEEEGYELIKDKVKTKIKTKNKKK